MGNLHGVFAFEGGGGLPGAVDMHMFVCVRHIARERLQFALRDRTWVVRQGTERFLQQAIIDLVPNTFFLCVDGNAGNPVNGPMIEGIPATEKMLGFRRVSLKGTVISPSRPLAGMSNQGS